SRLRDCFGGPPEPWRRLVTRLGATRDLGTATGARTTGRGADVEVRAVRGHYPLQRARTPRLDHRLPYADAEGDARRRSAVRPAGRPHGKFMLSFASTQ